MWRKLRPGTTSAPRGGVRNASLGELPTVIYLDARAFTRDCVGGWLRSSLSGFTVRVLSDPDQIETAPDVARQDPGGDHQCRPRTDYHRRAIARLLSARRELLPEVPVTVLSDLEDAQSVRDAFELGVRGYIPTSLASPVAIGAVQLGLCRRDLCAAGALLSQETAREHGRQSADCRAFTQRQSQILDCLRRGMANKLIAYELNMCESTVKVHIRNIMKKLNATNRTQVAYLTRGFFEDASQHQHHLITEKTAWLSPSRQATIWQPATVINPRASRFAPPPSCIWLSP